MRIIQGLTTLIEVIEKQLTNILMYDKKREEDILNESIIIALERLNVCLEAGNPGPQRKYWFKDGKAIFDIFHTDQYALFLYLLSNTIYKQFNETSLATRIYVLNKMFHSIDVYFEVELPRIFGFGHPLGTILGRATYSDYFGVGQRCTVGNNNGIYPNLSEHVTMLAGSTIIGKSIIGTNCIISSNTYIKDQDVPDNTIVFGNTPNLIFKENNLTFCRDKWRLKK
jgi:serine O-acetyltransferase